MSSPQGDSTPKKKALDLFCGAGGASEGLHRAGFEVTGVDIALQPNYPFDFILADALSVSLDLYDFVWASPPCKGHTSLRHLPRTRDRDYPDLVTPTRKLLIASGTPYCIENVPGAPLRKDLTLCGSMFQLGTASGEAELRRHRVFEIGGFPVPPQPQCKHGRRPVIGVYGHSGYNRRGQRPGVWAIHPRFKAKHYPQPQCEEAMGIDWMRREALSQAVPPAYSRYIAENFLLSLLPVGDGNPRVFTPDRCSATPPHDVYYTSLTTDQLLAEIAEAIRKIDASRRDTTAEMRRRLLPAIIELRKRLHPKKQFYKTLHEMGLNDSTVRSWFHRSRCADDLIDMLDPEPARPFPKTETEPLKRPEDGDPDTSEHFLRQADKMAAAILKGNYEWAARLAREYANARRSVMH